MNPIRYGMIGGGQGAFIGGVHRTAAAIAGNWKLAAGAFSSTAEKSKASGAKIGVPADRVYGSWAKMLEVEAKLPEVQRIEAVSIVTPNHMHAAPAIAALEAGFDVIIDKPLADTMANAKSIANAVARTGRRIAVTHKHPEQGAAEGAPFIARHLIRKADKAFDEFAGGDSDPAMLRQVLGLVA